VSNRLIIGVMGAVLAIGVVCGIGVAFPFNDLGSTVKMEGALFAIGLAAIESITIGRLARWPVLSAAAFAAAAGATFVLASALDYELGWRGVHWPHPYADTDQLLSGWPDAARVALSASLIAAPIGGLLGLIGALGANRGRPRRIEVKST